MGSDEREDMLKYSEVIKTENIINPKREERANKL